MRRVIFSLLVVAFGNISAFGALLREDQITARELADVLGFETRKLIFTFDAPPVYARADFVSVNAGQAVHLPITTPIPRSEIAFYYILRNTEANTKSITFQIGGQRINNAFKYLFNPSARIHDAYPDIILPPKLDSQEPIYVFLDWNPDIDRDLIREVPPKEIASRMKQGYYLALYFSDAPFLKP
jgi:hypothetical protein